jgi:uncharacterized surface protein with fasciclin (FAS1) repeats
MSHLIYSSKRATIALLALSFLFASCDKDDDDDTGPGQAITGIVVANNNYSTLEAAVIKANLQATLNGAGPFTVFAPDNAAFTASGITDATLNGLTPQQVSSILLYHTLPGKIPAASVPAGPNAKVTTASGDSVFVTRNASGVFVNGIKVEEADINASNGVIHRIGKVLLPPSGNLVATAQVQANGLDSLVKAVLRAANGPGGNPALVATLQSSTLTLFAPNNAAFTQLLGALGVSDINAIPVATLLAVLQYHVVPGRVFSSDLTNGQVTMLAGGTTTVNLNNGTDGGPTVTGSGNAMNKSNIIATNVMATNGVVHIIDRVLLP